MDVIILLLQAFSQPIKYFFNVLFLALCQSHKLKCEIVKVSYLIHCQINHYTNNIGLGNIN